MNPITLPIQPHTEAIASLFLRACKVKGLSLQEREVANFIRAELRDADVIIQEDEAGKKHAGQSGNLLVFPSEFDASKPCIVFFAHMDTVRDTSLCNAIIESDRIVSDGKNQLGVDNRAGLSVLIHVLKSRKEASFSTNFFVVFTIAEEIGMYGAYGLDLSAFDVECGVVFDSSKRPGNYIYQCAGMHLFEVEFTGKSTHSAVDPENGVNAIAAASYAISNMQFGRLAAHVTTNIGTIKGGDATNIVPGTCKVYGEVRALDVDTMDKLIQRYKSEFEKFGKKKGAEVKFSYTKDFSPYSLDAHPELIKKVEAAMSASMLTPTPLIYTGGSDANALNEKGIPSINLGVGAQNPHSDHEFILLEDLASTYQVAYHLLK